MTGGWPETAPEALRDLADWLDEADRLINRLTEAHGRVRINDGDDIQQSIRSLAVWFEAHPDVAAEAWAHVLSTEEATP